MPQLFGKSLSRAQLDRYCSDPSMVFGVDLLDHGDGPERGVRLLRFRTGGSTEFDVLLDRAMDIGSIRYMGVPVGWQGPAGFRHPAYHNPQEEDGLGWARSVSGLVSTCGLDHVHANTDDTADHYHYSLRNRVAHALHGRISFSPARLRGYGVEWNGDEAVLFAEAEIRQSALFAEQLSLVRRIEADVGGAEIRIHDTVTNIGFDPTPQALLYHVNLGFPVLDSGTELWADITATPFEMHSDGGDAIGQSGGGIGGGEGARWPGAKAGSGFCQRSGRGKSHAGGYAGAGGGSAAVDRQSAEILGHAGQLSPCAAGIRGGY